MINCSFSLEKYPTAELQSGIIILKYDKYWNIFVKEKNNR